MQINIKVSKDFENTLNNLKIKYGEDFEILNGFHESQMNFTGQWAWKANLSPASGANA